MPLIESESRLISLGDEIIPGLSQKKNYRVFHTCGLYVMLLNWTLIYVSLRTHILSTKLGTAALVALLTVLDLIKFKTWHTKKKSMWYLLQPLQVYDTATIRRNSHECNEYERWQSLRIDSRDSAEANVNPYSLHVTDIGAKKVGLNTPSAKMFLFLRRRKTVCYQNLRLYGLVASHCLRTHGALWQ